jgi:phospholipid/cholesterol/gamma-HCH transport system ATP-binding protein
MAEFNQSQQKNNPLNAQISVKGLKKAFNGRTILNAIDLDIEKGKTTVIIGPSGCGKTVLIKHLIVLIRPTAGSVFFEGQRIDNLSEAQLHAVRTRFGFLFQSGALFDSMTVAENILFPIRQHSNITDKKEMKQIVSEKLSLIGLEGFENYNPADLSGGQRKRVALARAIALNPDVILYDEPTTGLDPLRSNVIDELILKLKASLGLTSVVVTHDMKSVYKIADRVIMLDEGKIIADGTTEDIKNSDNPIVQRFIYGRAGEDIDAINSKLKNHG